MAGGVAAAGGRDDARQRLVLAHEGLAQWVARRYRGRGLDPDDLAQEARLGLLRAGARFDPARGVAFATYAPWWVRRTVQDAIRRAARAEAARAGARRPGVAAPVPGLPEGAERVRACLRRLSAAEAAVLRLRHGLDGCAPRTRTAVARLFGLRPDAVRRIEARARGRLKTLLEDQARRDGD
jgi:RNA polymerase sigma factor (sigma-70 family)